MILQKLENTKPRLAAMAEALHESCLDKAKEIFGLKELRLFQRNGAGGILNGKDVFISMPTGSGKSMAFLLLPFAFQFRDENCRPSAPTSNGDEFVLVISPLTSLIRDQTQNLKKKKIPCISLNDPAVSSKSVRESNYRFMFSSPESVLEKFRNDLKSVEVQKRLRCVVVDESHCVVKW